MTPLTVWLLTFLVWLFWQDIVQLFPGKASTRPGARIFPSPSASGRGKGEGASSMRDTGLNKNHDPQPATRPREDLADEDRKKLDDILKRR
jgi:hypothetical protein